MANPRNLGDKQVVRQDFNSVQSASVDNWTIASGSSITDGLLNLSAQKPFIPDWFWLTGGTLRVRVRPNDVDSTFRRFFFLGQDANFFISLTVRGSTGATILEVRNGSGNNFYAANQTLTIGSFNELVLVFDPSTPSWTSYLNGGSAVTDTSAGAAGLGAYDTNFDLIKVGSISGGSAVTDMDTDFIEIYQSQWTAEEASDAFDNDTYEEVDAQKAPLYLPMRAQFDDGSNQVTPNLGSIGGTVIVGDGSTSTTFPTVLTPKGFSFDGGDYLVAADNANLDFANAENFSFTFGIKDAVDTGGIQSIVTKVVDGKSGAGIVDAFGYDLLYRDDASNQVQLRLRDSDNDTDNITSTTDITGGQYYFVTFTCDWSVIRVFINGIEDAAAVDVTNLTGSLANNGSFNMGTEGSKTGFFLQATLVDFCVWREALTPRQIGWLHQRFLKEINL